jgi:hypothetical protein
MKLNKNTIIYMVLSVAIALLIFNSVRLNGSLQALEREYHSQSVQLTEQLKRAEDESVTRKELEEYIDSLIADNDALHEDIDNLKSQPTSAGRVVVTVPGATEVVQGNFPTEWVYRTESGMPVASHLYEDDEFTAQTYNLEVLMSMVMTEDRQGREYTYIDSQIASAADGELYPVDVVANFAHVKPDPTFKLIDPHVNLGATLPIPDFSPRAGLGVSISSIGPTTYENSLRFSNIKLEVGRTLAVGIDPVGINIAKTANLPLVQDTWLWAGTAVELVPDFGSWTMTLSVSSTL